ncbi:hypothetical protein BDV97DRAFT_402824 [Delphinella strobiligena]|nr:hypothetical protein BDV97DRAFT_402824 [Delphinella strobiligena]
MSVSNHMAHCPHARYPTSKLILLLAIREIAARGPVSEDLNAIITCQTPGLCYSDLQRNKPAIAKVIIAGLQAILARSAEIGGRTLVHAVEPNLDVEAHGEFLMNCEIAENGSRLDSEAGHALQMRVADELFPKLEKIESGVTACLTAKST